MWHLHNDVGNVFERILRGRVHMQSAVKQVGRIEQFSLPPVMYANMSHIGVQGRIWDTGPRGPRGEGTFCTKNLCNKQLAMDQIMTLIGVGVTW